MCLLLLTQNLVSMSHSGILIGMLAIVAVLIAAYSFFSGDCAVEPKDELIEYVTDHANEFEREFFHGEESGKSFWRYTSARMILVCPFYGEGQYILNGEDIDAGYGAGLERILFKARMDREEELKKADSVRCMNETNTVAAKVLKDIHSS